jgi:predicted peptidase
MRILITIILIIHSFVSADAQILKRDDNYSQHYYKSLRYGWFRPANFDSKQTYPLVVYLHGSRDTVSRDLVWYGASVQQSHPCFVLSPKCDEPEQGWGNTWQEGHTIATVKVLALVDSLVRHGNIDTDRIYLYGISMGGFGVFSILAKEKGKFAAAYAVCGGSKVDAARDLIDTPLWIFHGESDDVVPVSLSRNVYNEVIRLGGKNVRYTEYPNVKHNSWENVSKEKSLLPWLFAQRRGGSK